MKEYKKIVKEVLEEGQFKENRTDVHTISKFNYNYTLDVKNRLPLLTTKDMGKGRWESMLRELLWYISGEEHVSNLKQHTSIWDIWSDDNDMLETAYGRFWRRYPFPDRGIKGEAWVNPRENDNVNYEGMFENGQYTFDQIGFVIDNIKKNPNSRRHIVNAWHPVNATESKLPPCHYTFAFNVQNKDTLNLHLTQRSGDIALGVPFNIASYSLLLKIIAQETGLSVGKFSHSIVDAHIYCGKDERGKWYKNNLEIISERTSNAEYEELRKEINNKAPEQEENYDHVPNLLKQLQREPYDSPTVEINDKSIGELEFEDFDLIGYQSHDSLEFGVAE